MIPKWNGDWLLWEDLFHLFWKSSLQKKKDVVFHLQIQIFNPKKKKNTKFVIPPHETTYKMELHPKRFAKVPTQGGSLAGVRRMQVQKLLGKGSKRSLHFFPFVENVGKCHPGWLVCLVGDWLGLCGFCMLSLSLPLSLFLRFSLCHCLSFDLSCRLRPLLLRVFFRMVRQRKGGV